MERTDGVDVERGAANLGTGWRHGEWTLRRS
jgi:hypothetical protein